MADDSSNVVKLAALQDSGGEIPPTAEDSMALVFAERHAGHLRFVASWHRWLHYDGVRWVQDETLHAFDLARAIGREVAQACLKPANSIMSAKTVAAIERLARADRRLAATAAQWDVPAWLVNTGEDDGDV